MTNPSEGQIQTPESLAIQNLDIAAQQVLATYGKPETLGLSELEPGDTVIRAHSSATGDSLRQITKADGVVNYEYKKLFYSSADKGAFITAWQQGSNTAARTINSEMDGTSAAESLDVTVIDALSSTIPQRFEPRAKVQEKPQHRVGPMRGFLGKLAVIGRH